MQTRVAFVVVLVAMSGCIDLLQEEFSHHEQETSPSVAFSDDEASDQIVVMQAPANLDWDDFNITGDRPAYFRLNDGPTRQFSPARQSEVGIGAVSAGDKISFCLPVGGGLETRVLYTPQNVILHVFTFSTVDRHQWCG